MKLNEYESAMQAASRTEGLPGAVANIAMVFISDITNSKLPITLSLEIGWAYDCKRATTFAVSRSSVGVCWSGSEALGVATSSFLFELFPDVRVVSCESANNKFKAIVDQ